MPPTPPACPSSTTVRTPPTSKGAPTTTASRTRRIVQAIVHAHAERHLLTNKRCGCPARQMLLSRVQEEGLEDEWGGNGKGYEDEWEEEDENDEEDEEDEEEQEEDPDLDE